VSILLGNNCQRLTKVYSSTFVRYGCGPSAKKVKELIFSGDKGTLYLEFNTSRCEMQVYDNSNELLMKSESEAPPKNVPNHAFGSGTYVLAKEVAAYLAAPSSVPAHLATFEGVALSFSSYLSINNVSHLVTC